MNNSIRVGLGIIVAAMGAVIFQHSPFMGFIQIIGGGLLAAIGVTKLIAAGKKSEAA